MAFGAVEAWSTFTFEAGAVAVFVVWAGKQLLASQVTLSKNPLYLPVLLFLGLIFLQIAFRRSAYAYVTKYEALQYVSYGIVFLVAVEAIRGADARKKFALVMTVFGTLYAWFALAQDLTSNGKLFWVRTPQFGGSMYGSYVNRDHYAGLMEMLVPIPLVLSMGHLFKGAQRILVGFCAVLMASTIFLSGSRGGMLAFFVEMVLLGALMFRKKRSPRAVLGYVAVCVFIAALICFSSKGQVLGRFGDLSPGMRLHISKDSLRMFAKRPLYGWGLGTFPTVYPRYRSFHTNLFVNEAHNDYAQLLVETGLLSRTIDEIDLRTVEDITFHQSFGERLFGLGQIGIVSSEPMGGTAMGAGFARTGRLRAQLVAVANARAVREQIRNAAYAASGKQIFMRPT